MLDRPVTRRAGSMAALRGRPARARVPKPDFVGVEPDNSGDKAFSPRSSGTMQRTPSGVLLSGQRDVRPLLSCD